MTEERPSIEKKMGVQGVYYLDRLHERHYGRVVGGFTWPGKKPGYAMIIASDRWPDPAYDAPHLWTLAEREETEIQDLFKWMLRASGHWQVEQWMGDLSSFSLSDLLETFNRSQREKKLPEIRAWTPSHLEEAERFAAAMTTARTFTALANKLLHLGPCELLKAQLRAFPPDAIDKARDWPALLALSYVLESAKQPVSPPADTRQRYAICDYDPFDHDRYR